MLRGKRRLIATPTASASGRSGRSQRDDPLAAEPRKQRVLMLGLPHINSCDFERNEHQSAAVDAGVQATSETEPLVAAPKSDLSIVCLPPPSEGVPDRAAWTRPAPFLAHAAAIAAKGNDLAVVGQASRMAVRGRDRRTQRPKVGDLDRDPDPPAVLARDLKLDQEGQGLQDHLAPRRLVDQAVELVANGGQLHSGPPASERRGSRKSARADRASDGSGID